MYCKFIYLMFGSYLEKGKKKSLTVHQSNTNHIPAPPFVLP